MHPLLADRRRLLLYLLVWIPGAGVLAFLFVLAARMSWSQAAALAVPMTVVYAFIGLSAYYLCRAAPLAEAGIARIVATHLVGAFLASAAWVLAGQALAEVLSRIGALAGLDERLGHALPLVSVVGVLFFLLAVAAHYVIIAVDVSQQAERIALEARVLSREAELRALRAQLQPHFLFNALNSISALTTVDAAGARRMCLLLSDFFRRSLRLGAREAIAFDEELGLVEAFLTIERVRFSERLNVEVRVDDDTRRCLVPPLVLQPLVENAVGHGIAQLVEGGTVAVTARLRAGRLEVTVENPCDPERSRKGGTGIGLANVRKRLEAVHGREARVSAVEDGGRFRVELSLPCQPDEGLPPTG